MLNHLGYKFGSKTGSDGLLHKSKSRYPKYYLTESEQAIIDLENLRKSHTIMTCEK